MQNIFKQKNAYVSTGIFIITLISAFFYNEINLNYLKTEFPENVRLQETIQTADDDSYLSPPNNWLKTGIWKDGSDNSDKRSYFIRPPGYGTFYLFHIFLFGETTALKALKISQLILFALSILLLYKICIRQNINNLITFCLIILYGISPFAIGFLFYTLTEGITPALVIIYLYFITEGVFHKNSNKKFHYYIYASLTMAIIFTVRPVLAIFGLFLFLIILNDFIVKKNFLYTIKHAFIIGIISCSLFTVWSVRNYNIAGEFVGFHPIYYNESNSIYRKTHQAIWEFYKCWGINNDSFHSLIAPIWNAGIKGDTSIQSLSLAIEAIPKEVTKDISEKEIINSLKMYQATIIGQKEYLDKKQSMPKDLSPLEKNTINNFTELKNLFIKTHFLTYHVIVPFKNFVRLAGHSNLSLGIFQKKWRGNFVMEFFRLLFFAFHFALITAVFISVFIFRNDLYKLAFPISAILYIIFICYFLREWEERYTLPLLPVCIINFAYLINHFSYKKKLN